MSKIDEGKKAPDFTLADQNEKPVSLSGLKGKEVIVYFYPKDDTPGCTKEACGIRDFWKDLQKTGAVILGVSPDGAAAHQKFIAKYKLPHTLLSDPDKDRSRRAMQAMLKMRKIDIAALERAADGD